MTEIQVSMCPGCGLEMPLSKQKYGGKFHASPECWSVLEEVLAAEFQNAVLFGQVHQLTVDAYAVQHEPPRKGASMTVFDVALADSAPTHALSVREWAVQVWQAWARHHDRARDLASGLV